MKRKKKKFQTKYFPNFREIINRIFNKKNSRNQLDFIGKKTIEGDFSRITCSNYKVNNLNMKIKRQQWMNLIRQYGLVFQSCLEFSSIWSSTSFQLWVILRWFGIILIIQADMISRSYLSDSIFNSASITSHLIVCNMLTWSSLVRSFLSRHVGSTPSAQNLILRAWAIRI
ncbi:uncharacterized protein LOC111296875 [Durio zibethinus]|uniref:Uncharacterized protein LOC111296875 n=1 Tax=Durio zibethinus TaxID=66656 RepID=A0A6P5Z2X6_DURZI|nr:uncharacterized protein LOC111296875 [Durio zibethinus]